MLTADQARQLDRLALAANAGAASAAAGRRATKARGYSVEFHDFRRYQPGDDPRSIDWTIDARLRQLVVRLFRAEGHVPLHLLVDTSASMTSGSPSKLALASKAAAALAYVAVLRRDPVALATFDDTIRAHVPPAQGRAQLFRVFDALGSMAGVGRSAIDGALTAYGGTVRGPGLAVVLSDFFDPSSRLDGLRFLLYRGLTVAVVQLLADDEIDPNLNDPVELVDIENLSAPPLLVDPSEVPAYRERLAALTHGLQEFCASQSLPFVRLASSAHFGDLVSACTHAGLLELHA